MKKLVAIAVVLALPAMAYGYASISLVHNGSSYLYFDNADLPGTLTLDVVVNFDEEQNSAVTGGLSGSSLITVASRSYGSPQSGWVMNDSQGVPTPIVGSNLDAHYDFGASNQAGAGAGYIASGEHTFVTLTLNLPSTLPHGPITIDFVDSDRAMLGYTNVGATGDTLYFDAVNGFTINPLDVPEPATLLLLAGALPFLRRRNPVIE